MSEHESTTAQWDALVIHASDDVALALRDVAAGETVVVRKNGMVTRFSVIDAIPLGHKFALRELVRGTPIHKYGECIGAATADIAAGAHVHVHNMASLRGRRPS
jgi:altronate dehydratase small subunit